MKKINLAVMPLVVMAMIFAWDSFPVKVTIMKWKLLLLCSRLGIWAMIPL